MQDNLINGRDTVQIRKLTNLLEQMQFFGQVFYARENIWFI